MPLNLVLSLPQGSIIATSLGVDGFAWHRSPGSGKYFLGRSILVDLAIKDGKPAFEYNQEGGWRDAMGDTVAALEGAAKGKRTKTALSNLAFSPTPISSYKGVYISRTGGQVLELEKAGEIAKFKDASWRLNMAPDDVADAIGLPKQANRQPRLYMIFAPIELVVLSSLTPAEYVWYATHRNGKIFRKVMFTELKADQVHLAAEAVFQDARRALIETPSKKTKTVYAGEALNRVPYNAWVGYERDREGGIYVGDQNSVCLWKFPTEIPRAWERAAG